jgi:REP element-mobilizing transposase RayT
MGWKINKAVIVYTSLQVHIVWITKYRYAVLWIFNP